MITEHLTTSRDDIEKAAKIIAAGGLVAFPTETVYGLGADALNEKAVASVYEAKGRPSDNPMIVHIAKREDLDKLTPDRDPRIDKIADSIWPGPLTIVVSKRPEIPERTTGGLDTVAVRMPDSETALQLIEMAGCPIAAPSANLSGSPSPTRARDVAADMDGRIDAIIYGGDCRVGIESTVLDLTGAKATILRPGYITADALEEILGEDVEYDRALKGDPANEADFKPRSPGMKYKHYAPKAEMIVIKGRREDVADEIERRKKFAEEEGKKVGVIQFGEEAFAEAAHDFFSRLRDLDAQGVDLILAGALSDEDGVGFAVMNRMLKSAGYNVIRV